MPVRIRSARTGIRKMISSHDLFDDFPVDIRQSVITSCVSEEKSLVIDPQQMHDRRVKVVHMDQVLRDRHAVFVR